MGKTYELLKKEQHDKLGNEMKDQLANNYLCGSCVMGFTDIELYKAHCDEEQHNYHITRRIELLVPGLGFCPACSCLIQTPKGWDKHLATGKHAKCVESLTAIGLDGNYDKPLGCVTPGELGAPISHEEISQKEATKHGYGHGGLVIPNVPLIGMNEVQLSNKDDKSDQPKYHCGICDINFTYEHRAKHMIGIEHRMNYFESRYPDYHQEISDLKTTKTNHPVLLSYRIMYLAHKVEELELELETEFAKKLRVKWKTEATMKTSSAPTIPRSRGSRGSHRGGRGGPGFRGAAGAGYIPFHGPPPGHPHFRGGMGPRPRFGPPRHPTSTIPFRRGGPPRHFQEYYEPEEYSTLGKRGSCSGDYPPHSFKKHKHDPYAEAGDINQLQEGDWDATMDPYEAQEDTDEYSRAMEAIRVLEDYAMDKAAHSIKSRIDDMRRAMRRPPRGGRGGRGGSRMPILTKSDISSLTDPYTVMRGGPGPGRSWRPGPPRRGGPGDCFRGGPGPSSPYRGGPGRGGPGPYRGGPGPFRGASPRMGSPFRGARRGPRF